MSLFFSTPPCLSLFTSALSAPPPISSLLTVFIILSRNDRAPSNMQLASLALSLLCLLKYQIEKYLLNKYLTQLPIMEKIPKAAVLLPMFLTNNIFKLGSLALVCAMLRYWAAVGLAIIFFTVLLGLWIIARCHGKNPMNIMFASPNHAYNLMIARSRPIKGNTSFLTPKETKHQNSLHVLEEILESAPMISSGRPV